MTALRWFVAIVLTLMIAGAATAAVLLNRARESPPPHGLFSAERPDYAEIENTARESSAALLSYEPATVRASLTKARELLTGNFKQSYTDLTDTVVIPGAEDKQITSKAEAVAVGVTDVDTSGATVLVFVNQTTTTGSQAPASTASSVRLHMVEVDDRWLIDEFDPV